MLGPCQRSTLQKAFLAFIALSCSVENVCEAQRMHRKFQMDRSGAKGQQSLLQSLFGPITHIPDPPPLPENPIPFGAAVFDPMTESWYTTQFDPFDDSDIDNTETPAKLPDLLNATQTAMDGSALKNITTSTTDLLRHHLPILAKVVSKLFQGQDESQKQDQPSQLRLNVAANAHGYLTKSLEPSDTRAVRRGPTDKQSQESPSVPYFEQDIDPAPDAEAAIQIPEHSTLTQGGASDAGKVVVTSMQTSTTHHGSPMGKATAVLGIVALCGVTAVLIHWFITTRRKKVARYTDLSGDESLELGDYETFTDIAKASNFGPSQLKENPNILSLDHGDGETVPAFRPDAKEQAHHP